MNSNDEKELVKKAQKEPEAFAKLYDKYYPQIFGYILKRVADLEIAQDITSETFLKIQEKIAKHPIKYQEVITLRFFEKKEN